MSPRHLAARLVNEKQAQRRRLLLDTLERTARTFVQGFLGVTTLDSLTTHVNLHFTDKLAAGALAGLFAILTAFAGAKTGAKDSASFLPADVDPPQGDSGHFDPMGLLVVLLVFVVALILLGRL